VNGYLDKLAVSDVGKFEQGLLSTLRAEGTILETIRTEKAVSDDTKGKLKAALDSFAKSFA
jgi:F-type H+-transporting ATPase subunit alpha